MLVVFLLIAQMVRGQLVHDESHLDADFSRFKLELSSCVVTKDKDKFMTFLADSIRSGGEDCSSYGCSKEEFMAIYFGEWEDDAWKELEVVMRYGFQRKEDHNKDIPVLHESLIFLAPSFQWKFDSDRYLLVTGENVNIRKTPSTKAAIVRQASWVLLECDCGVQSEQDSTFQQAEGKDWVEVRENGQVLGYVAREFTSVDIFKQLIVARVDGKWKIIEFANTMGC